MFFERQVVRFYDKCLRRLREPKKAMKETVKKFGLHRSTIYRHMERLKNSRILRPENAGRMRVSMII